MNFKRNLKNLWKRFLLYEYQSRIDDISKAVFSKSQINIVFFATNIGMWKCDGLFQLLLEDKRFNPVILSFLLTNNSKEYWEKVQNDMKLYFEKKGYPYYDSYDFKTDTWINLKQFHIDIVIYAQQGNYNASHANFRIEPLMRKCLFAYTPYGWITQNEPSLYDSLLTAIAWKIFVSTPFDKEMYGKYSKGRDENCVITGCGFADDIAKADDQSIWGMNADKRLKIIWAPHHSILATDLLDYSNFLRLAEPMLQLAEKYSEEVVFAFKPHPRLRDKLYKLKDWGVEKTNKYYNEWATRPNTILADGSYDSLFKFSDALVHDCGAFSVEYLYTVKPVMYITNNPQKHFDSLNEFGKQCFNQHYKGSTISDIENFIFEVVKKGNDPMRKTREEFYNDYLIPPNHQSVAGNMYGEFTKMLKG